MPRIPNGIVKEQPKEQPAKAAAEAPKPPAPVQVIERRIETAVVEIPLGEPPRRFDQVHVEGWLRREDAHTFARLRQALWDRGEKTTDGRPVKSAADVMRWMMEQLAAAL